MGILDRLLGRSQEQPAKEDNSMHAVLITFTSSASLDDLKALFTDYANALRGVHGLIAKTWIRDGSTLGGFHVFASRQDAEGYLDSEMVAGLTSAPAFSDFQIRQFDVLDELSAITGSPQAALAR
jgi:hypothetical protein